MLQKNVWFTQEHASSCWQLREWSCCLSTSITGSILRPKSPHVLPALTIWSQPPASPLAMPGIRWFTALQKWTLADVTMYLRSGSWSRESQCLEDGSEHLGLCSLPWVSTTTAQVRGRRCAFATASRFPRFECCLGCSWRQNENVFLREDQRS